MSNWMIGNEPPLLPPIVAASALLGGVATDSMNASCVAATIPKPALSALRRLIS